MQNKELAPIVLFIFNRPEHTRKTLEALNCNVLASESLLYIIADGPKDNTSSEEIELINKTRAIAKSKKWCKEIIIEEKQENWGLANSIVKGVSEIINKHGKIIVLEDDIVPQVGFLKYMNEALVTYLDNTKVMHISGYIYPNKTTIKSETLFLNILSCWGWATWKRAWQNYCGETDVHLANFSSKKAIKKFNIEGHANYYEQLILNKTGRINSWAVKWYASWLYKGGYSLFPHKSIVENIGHDGSGVHNDNTSIFIDEVINHIKFDKIPILEDTKVRKSIDVFYKKTVKKNIKEKSVLNVLKHYSKFVIKYIFIKPLRKLLLKILPELNSIKPKTTTHNCNISNKSKIYSPATIHNSTVSDYTYISQNAIINSSSIGKFCSIGPNLICGWGIHPTNTISTSPMFYSTLKQNGVSLTSYNKIKETKAIKIGHDVFIGMNVTILDGVTIGNGAVIGAGAVVSKNIPPYAIAVGNPIQIIKYRFERDTIEKMEKMEWWNWSIQKLRLVEKEFFNIQAFCNIDEEYCKD